MATIGLDKLYYAKITEDENGNETYATPVQLAKAMNADLSVELAEATLYADDGAAEIVKEFKNGTLSLDVDDVGASVASDLTGATIDANGVVVSTSEDGGDPVAVGFRAKKSNGKYKYDTFFQTGKWRLVFHCRSDRAEQQEIHLCGRRPFFRRGVEI